MNVLTITQSFVLGGLESRIHGDFNWANEHGIGTYLATSENVVEGNLPKASLGIATGLNICDTTSSTDLLRTVTHLADIVEQQHIDVVHAHPFAALWPAFLVSQLTRRPLIVSLHGPASLSPAQRGIQWRLQMAFVLTHASLLACVSRETDDLVRSLVFHDRIRIFPNCVDTKRFYPIPKKPSGRWALISRLDEHKKDGVAAFFEMLPELPIIQLDVIGDGVCRSELERLACSSRLNKKIIRFLGAHQNIDTLMNEYDGVVGMGRVALEALAKALPVILLGYDGVKGGLKEELIERVAYSNFSGRGLENTSSDELRRWLASDASIMRLDYLKKIIQERYGETQLWQDFYAGIHNLPFVKCVVLDELVSILKRNNANTAPYCDDDRISHEIESLLDTQERMCLGEVYSSSRNYDIFNVTRGWRLAAIAENDVRCHSLVRLREKEIDRLMGSVSWRLTRPIRGAYWAFSRLRNFVQNKHLHPRSKG